MRKLMVARKCSTLERLSQVDNKIPEESIFFISMHGMNMLFNLSSPPIYISVSVHHLCAGCFCQIVYLVTHIRAQLATFKVKALTI